MFVMSIWSESSVSSEIYSVVLMYPLQIEIVCVLHHRHKVVISELADAILCTEGEDKEDGAGKKWRYEESSSSFYQ